MPEGDCVFCVPIAGTNRLRAGYAVVAAVTSVGFVACGTSASCAFTGDPPRYDDSGPDEVPALAGLDAWTPGDGAPTDGATDAADAADAASPDGAGDADASAD